jgi:hypothetical protein
LHVCVYNFYLYVCIAYHSWFILISILDIEFQFSSYFFTQLAYIRHLRRNSLCINIFSLPSNTIYWIFELTIMKKLRNQNFMKLLFSLKAWDNWRRILILIFSLLIAVTRPCTLFIHAPCNYYDTSVDCQRSQYSNTCNSRKERQNDQLVWSFIILGLNKPKKVSFLLNFTVFGNYIEFQNRNLRYA